MRERRLRERRNGGVGTNASLASRRRDERLRDFATPRLRDFGAPTHPRIFPERARDRRDGEPPDEERQRGGEDVSDEHSLAVVSTTDGGEDEDGGDVAGDEFGDARPGVLVGINLGDALEGVRGALFDGDDLDAGGAGGVGVGSRTERGGARRRGGRVAALEPALLGGRGGVRVRHGRGVAVGRAGDERGGAAKRGWGWEGGGGMGR